MNNGATENSESPRKRVISTRNDRHHDVQRPRPAKHVGQRNLLVEFAMNHERRVGQRPKLVSSPSGNFADPAGNQDRRCQRLAGKAERSPYPGLHKRTE